MKLTFLIITVFLAVIVQPSFPQQSREPLSDNQVIAQVKAGMVTPGRAKLIHAHGIEFDLAYDSLQSPASGSSTEPVLPKSEKKEAPPGTPATASAPNLKDP